MQAPKQSMHLVCSCLRIKSSHPRLLDMPKRRPAIALQVHGLAAQTKSTPLVLAACLLPLPEIFAPEAT
eukprot:379669-Pelagomonas_calceolata.AAC.3